MTQMELQIAYKAKIELVPEFCWLPKRSLSGQMYWLRYIKRRIEPIYLDVFGSISPNPNEYRIVYID